MITFVTDSTSKLIKNNSVLTDFFPFSLIYQETIVVEELDLN